MAERWVGVRAQERAEVDPRTDGERGEGGGGCAEGSAGFETFFLCDLGADWLEGWV